MASPYVVLVDRQAREIGLEERMRAHVLGLLHRAVSVFVFNRSGELLLQRRAAKKYHCGGAWSNTACGHPEPGEDPVVAAARRLREEMGITCALHAAGTFLYRLPVGQGLIEHEFDHLFCGRSDGAPEPDPDEVQDWCWMPLDALARDLRQRPSRYSPWLPGALIKVCQHLSVPVETDRGSHTRHPVSGAHRPRRD